MFNAISSYFKSEEEEQEKNRLSHEVSKLKTQVEKLTTANDEQKQKHFHHQTNAMISSLRQRHLEESASAMKSDIETVQEKQSAQGEKITENEEAFNLTQPIWHRVYDELRYDSHQLAKRIRKMDNGTTLLEFQSIFQAALETQISSRVMLSTNKFRPHDSREKLLHGIDETLELGEVANHIASHEMHDSNLEIAGFALKDCFSTISFVIPLLTILMKRIQHHREHNIIHEAHVCIEPFLSKTTEQQQAIIKNYTLKFTMTLSSYLVGQRQSEHQLLKYANIDLKRPVEQYDVLNAFLQLSIAETLVNLKKLKLNPYESDAIPNFVRNWVQSSTDSFISPTEHPTLLLNVPSTMTRFLYFRRKDIKALLKIKRIIDGGKKIDKTKRYPQAHLATIEQCLTQLQAKLHEQALTKYDCYLTRGFFLPLLRYLSGYPSDIKAVEKYVYTVSYIIRYAFDQLASEFNQQNLSVHQQYNIIDLLLLIYTKDMLKKMSNIPGMSKVAKDIKQFEENTPVMDFYIPAGDNPNDIIRIQLDFESQKAISEHVALTFVLKDRDNKLDLSKETEPWTAINKLKESFIRNSIRCTAKYYEDDREESLNLEEEFLAQTTRAAQQPSFK